MTDYILKVLGLGGAEELLLLGKCEKASIRGCVIRDTIIASILKLFANR